jgi:hypothetical protein
MPRSQSASTSPTKQHLFRQAQWNKHPALARGGERAHVHLFLQAPEPFSFHFPPSFNWDIKIKYWVAVAVAIANTRALPLRSRAVARVVT